MNSDIYLVPFSSKKKKPSETKKIKWVLINGPEVVQKGIPYLYLHHSKFNRVTIMQAMRKHVAQQIYSIVAEFKFISSTLGSTSNNLS